MRSHVSIIAFGALLIGCAACSDDDAQYANPVHQVTVTAHLVGPEADEGSRTQIDTSIPGDNLHMLWLTTDQIGVFNEAGMQYELKPDITDPAEEADFKGTVEGDLTSAYYPYVADATDPTKVPVTIGDQNYADASSLTGTDIKVGVINSVDGNNYDISFYPIAAMLKFTVDITDATCISSGDVLKKVVISNAAGSNAEAWAGTFTFDATAGRSAALKSETPSDQITITLGENGAGLSFDENNTPVTFYAAVAPYLKANDKIQIQLYSETTTDQTVASKVTQVTLPIELNLKGGSVYKVPMHMKVAEANPTAYDFTQAIVVDKTSTLATGALSEMKFTLANNPDLSKYDVKVSTSGATSTTGDTHNSYTAANDYTLTITEGTDGGTIDLCIPYLYNFAIVPNFALDTSLPEGSYLRVGDNIINSGATAIDFSEGPTTLTVCDGKGGERDYVVNITNSGLPVVVLNTNGDTGTASYSWCHTTVAAKTSDWPTANTIAIYNADGSADVAEMDCGFRLRGNSSMNMPQKPFAIKLSSKQSVLGMPSHKRWCLIAAWQDNSRIRNQVAFEIAHIIQNAFTDNDDYAPGMIWNPSGVNVEVVLNGAHIGNYMLCEQIKIGSKRLAINDCYEDRLADGLPTEFEDCGYLLEFDDNYDETYKFVTSLGLPCMSKDDVLDDDLWSQLKTYVQNVETLLVEEYYDASKEVLDWPSIIDWWMVHELTMNAEYRHPKSVYMYKDGAGKLCAGPIWDFDYQTFPCIANIGTSQYGSKTYPYAYTSLMCNSYSYSNSTSVSTTDAPFMWYPYLFKNDDFKAMVKARWAVLYPLLSAVESKIEELGP